MPPREPIDLNQWLRDQEEDLRVALGDDAILVVECGSVRPVSASPTQLRFAMDQLLANAREAMVKPGQVTVATSLVTLTQRLAAKGLAVDPGDYVILTVTDTGRGMTGPTLGHLFERFFTTKDGHLGLGLSTVHDLVGAWGGVIVAHSRIGEGSSFKLYLPPCQGIGLS